MAMEPPTELTPRQICEQLAPAAEELETIRLAQNRWRDQNPVEAKTFFLRLLESDPSNARYLYLAARVAPDPCEAIRLIRRSLEQDKNLLEALRLLLYSYSWALFRRGARSEEREKLHRALEVDTPHFERAFSETPFDGSLLGMVLEYNLYSRDHEQARKTLKLAKKLGQDWAVDPRAPMVLRAANGEDDTVRKYVEKVVGKKASKKLIPVEDVDAEIVGELIRFYKKGLNFERALEVSSEWLSVAPREWRPVSLVQHARIQALLDRDEAALDSLMLAVEVGWDDPVILVGYNEFLRLHGDSSWARLISHADANREATRQRSRSEAMSRKVDQVPEPFVLQGMKGVSLSWEEMRGGVTILDFWATSCRPCRRLMPELDHFVRSLENPCVQVYSVNCRDANRAQALHFMKLLGLSLTPLFGDLSIERHLGVTGVPAMLVFDTNGHIRFREQGQHPGLTDRLTWWIEDLLAELTTG